MGAGKTTILGEASDLLSARGIVHAAIDLDAVNAPLLPDATARELTLQNLAAICANVRAAGIDRLLLAEAVESRADLERIAAAAGARSTVVCRVTADLATLQRRVRAREPGMLQEQLAARARELDAILSAAAVEDFTVANDGGHSVTAVARELLQRAGWLAA
jgi:hypothetical protein